MDGCAPAVHTTHCSDCTVWCIICIALRSGSGISPQGPGSGFLGGPPPKKQTSATGARGTAGQDDSIRGIPSELAVGRLRVGREELYGVPCTPGLLRGRGRIQSTPRPAPSHKSLAPGVGGGRCRNPPMQPSSHAARPGWPASWPRCGRPGPRGNARGSSKIGRPGRRPTGCPTRLGVLPRDVADGGAVALGGRPLRAHDQSSPARQRTPGVDRGEAHRHAVDGARGGAGMPSLCARALTRRGVCADTCRAPDRQS